MAQPGGREKPKGLIVLGILVCAGGLMDVYGFLSLLWDPGYILFYSIEALGWFNFYISLPVALLSFAVAYAFFTGRRWGWSLGMVCALVGLGVCAINLLGRGSDPVVWAIILVNALIIFYLARGSVRRYFRQ